MIDPKSYRSKIPDEFSSKSRILQVGSHDVRIIKVIFTNDRIKTINEPRLKEKQPKWKDRTNQVALVMLNKDGVFTHRLNLGGYKRFDEIPATERAGLVPMGDEMYAVDETTMHRIPDEYREAQCLNILNQIMFFAGCAPGSSIEELVGKKIKIVIEERYYAKKVILSVSSWMQPDEKGYKIINEDDIKEVESDFEPDF